MITTATRTHKVQEYYFSQKLREIEGMNQNGADVLNLGIGNPDLLPPVTATQQLIDNLGQDMAHGYQSYKGIPKLREAFADWYRRFYKVNLDADREILPLMGSKEGIMHVSLAFLNPGDGVLVPNPGYPTYRAVSELVGAKVVEYALQEDDNWYPDFEALEKLDLKQVKLMWVNYPNMPTGTPASRDLFKQLVDFGRRHQILICNDNPYSFILNTRPLSILDVDGAKEIAVELNSLSKSHNMAGYRVGMIAGAEQYIQAVLKIKSNMDSGMFKPLQLAAAKALEAGEAWYESINSNYAKRRKLVWELFDYLQCQYDRNQSGMFIWAKIPEQYESGYDFSDKLLKISNVFITPGNIFGSNGKSYARISLCSSTTVLKEAIRRVKASLEEITSSELERSDIRIAFGGE